MEWIDVKDRKPPYSVEVLVTLKSKKQNTWVTSSVLESTDISGDNYKDQSTFHGRKVTHWQLMPKGHND